MAEEIHKIKIKDLPSTDVVNDSDLFLGTDSFETFNITADGFAKYVSENEHIVDNYINKDQIGVANGIVPLNGSKKINGTYITYGTSNNTAYSGSAGKTLATNLDNHILDNNAHGLGNVNNTSDMDKPVSTAQQTAINTALNDAKSYTDKKIDAIVGEGASTTLDTIGEISKAIEDHRDVTDALNEAIGTKANASDLTSHTGNTTVHITSTERTNWNDANSKKHSHSNKTVLDNTTASYTTEEKTKLSGIATGAEVNQNAFGKVVVGSTTITADAKVDSLTLIGSNVTITPDSTNDKITIGITKENIESALGYTPGTGGGGISEDTNTTYSLSKSGNTITLTGSDGSTTSVTDSNTQTITGVKGNSESSYRTGNINLTAANIGALASNGTAKKAIADELGNTIINEMNSNTEPTNQKVGDYWTLDY